MIGILSGSSLNTSLGHIITRQVRLQGVTVGHRDGLEAMLRAMEQHKIVPVTDKVFAFDELKEAMAYGILVASFTVEDFSLERLKKIERAELFDGPSALHEVAQVAGTVGYELMCALAQRVPVVTAD